MTWYLIETLGQPPSASIVFKEGVERNWASVRRMSQDEGGLDRIEDLIGQVRRTGEPVDQIEVGRSGPRRVIMRPVLGYEGDVYGIKTWVSPPEKEVTPERAIASVNWDVETLVARHTLESYMMSSISPDGFGDTRDPGQFLRKVAQFDALNELAELCLNDGTRTQFQGRLTVLHDDTHLMAWRGLARAGAGPDGSEVRGMFHDVTDTEEPQISPLAALKLGTLDENSTGTVLVAYRDHGPEGPVIPVLMYWISPRPPYITESATDHRHSEIVGNLVNPEHFGEFVRAREVLKAGQDELEIPMVVELLGHDGQWVKVRFHLRRYPGAVGSLMHIGRFSRL
ncbi:DUF5593 domain-containing protein [Gordonia McavH-238-E]|uniref:GAF domain-containing protein n=1 Tax=Gordonia sp. McavH-238-E TaxID=2917736 RepID=UPI001EF66575|nr:GAF domain-containing protein [Gordonia sp. McavH-238-E]MCG7635279.1 DUF5593 domain-containing protein [Gordonia sp. McavH-238-E]